MESTKFESQSCVGRLRAVGENTRKTVDEIELGAMNVIVSETTIDRYG